MFNNLEVIMQKRKQLNIYIIISAILFSAYFLYYLSKGSLLWFVYSIFILILMVCVSLSTLKVKAGKLKPEFFEDDTFESTSSVEYPLATIASSYVVLCYISFSITETIIEEACGLGSIELYVYILVVLSLIYTCVCFTRRYSELHTLIYNNGFRIYSGDILFTDIKKYNFLKLKKSGYSFEINLGGEYHRFRVSEEQKWRIIELLESHGVA